MKVTLEIPLPPKGCAQNDHSHWRVRAKANQIHKDEAFAVALEQYMRVGQLCPPVVVHHTWYMARDEREGMRGVPRRYRPLDEGNAIGALKAAIDGIVLAGLLPSDAHNVLRWGDGRLFRTAKEHGGKSCVLLEFVESDIWHKLRARRPHERPRMRY